MPALQLWNDGPPGTGQYAPEGQSKQLVLLNAPADARYVPASHSVGAVEALLGQYPPAVQMRQSETALAPVAGKNVPTGQGFGVAEARGQKNPAGHA